jgi:hypothetical protein
VGSFASNGAEEYMSNEDGPKRPQMALDEMPKDMPVLVQLAKMETRLDHIDATIVEMKTDGREHRRATDRDFRLLFGALIIAALGLAGLMAKGFHWI